MLYLIVYIAASLMGSLIASKYLSGEAVLCICIILLFCVVLQLAVKRFRNFAVIVCMTAMIVGFVSYSIKYENSVRDVETLSDDLPIKVEAAISDVPQFRNGRYYYELDVVSMTSGNLTVRPDCKVALYTENRIDTGYCSTVSFTDKMYFTGAQNNFLFGNGVYAQFYCDDITVIKTAQSSFKKWILESREYIQNYIHLNLNQDAAGIVCGITIGDDSAVSDETSENFMRCGGSHVMAVSGMHASLVAALVMFILLNLGVDRKIAVSISVPMVFLFATISGFNYSTVRSAIMFLIFAISIVIFRDYHDMTALGVAVIAILIYDPFAVYDIGLLLSCSAIFGICLIHPLITKFLKKTKLFEHSPVFFKIFKYVFTTTVISLTCSVFTFPVSSLYFNEVSLVSPLTNIVLVLLAQGVLLFSVISVLFSLVPFLSPVGLISIKISGFFALAIKETVNTIGSLSFSSINTGNKYIPLLTVSVLFVLAVFIFIGIKPKNFIIASCISLVCVAVFVASFGIMNYNKTELFFVDTEKGVCVVITRNDTASVICTGDDKNNFKLKALLDKKGIDDIECLYLPDLSAVQSAGAVDIISTYNVAEIVVDSQKDGEYSNVVSACNESCPIRLIDNGQRYYGEYFTFLKGDGFSRVWVGNDSFTVLFEGYNYNNDLNIDHFGFAVLSDSNIALENVTFSDAVVCGDYKNVSDNCKSLSDLGVRCLMTNGKGNVSAYVDGDGRIVLNEKYS